MEIEPLLNQIDQLAGHFGRASSDLKAIAARGRAEDYRGVMQNSRLVLEAILRDLVTRELKQSVGKSMLDDLISKFRQQSNAGIIPTNILAHMGTVQAWGNLSAHDHAGRLSDEAVKVGRQEVVASLNSMVAILGWYAQRLGVTVDATAPTQPACSVAVTQADSPPVSPQRRTGLLALIAAAALSGLGGALWWTLGRSPQVAPPAAPFAALDEAYRARGEPAPPTSCRRVEQASTLAAASTAAQLQALEGPEAEYLLARLTYEGGGTPGPELARAVACPGFAAAQSLAGKAEVRAGEASSKRGEAEPAAESFRKAARHFDAALADAPTFKNARFNRGLVLLKLNQVVDGTRDLEEVVRADPAFAEAQFYLGVALEAQARAGEASLLPRAKEAFCAAAKGGVAAAQGRCQGSP